METLLRNVRYAVRVLARTPVFTATVVLTLAIGIGANGAVFSAIDAILLQPLSFPDADRLVLLSESREGAPISNTAPVRIEEWNEGTETFAAITGYYTEDVSETSGDLPEKFRRARVAPRFLDVWGVAPVLGRGFTAAESQEGAPLVALISHRYWTTRLASDANVLERQLRLGDEAFSIIGVMPASFRFPDRDVDFWVPRIYFPFVLERGNLWYSAYGRLEPGVTVEQARADLALVQARLAERYPETDRNVGVYVAPLKETTIGDVRGSLWLLFGAVTLLLLIASTNIAALLLARAARREQEISLRLSLGASPRSVAAQVLTETAVLTVAGAGLGLLVALGVAAALRIAAPDFPRIDEIGFDGRILVYTLVSIVLVTAACGLLPALRSARGTPSGAMADARRTQVSSRHSLQWLFVGVQVALSVVLLAGSGLLIRSLLELSRVDPGFEPSRVLSLRISGSYEDFFEFAPRVPVILDELQALPGVEATAMTAPVPGVLDDGSGFQFGLMDLEIEGREAEETRTLAEIRVVSPSYFETMQIPLLTGELCRPRTDERTEFMVNAAFATRYLGGASAVGTGLRIRNSDVGFARVTGVVGDAREFGLNRAPVPSYYVCSNTLANPAVAFLVRTRGEPTAIAQAVREKVKDLEPLRSVYDMVPLTQRLGDEYAEDRLRTAALALFAGTALALAALGVYGTLSYVVSLKRREVGLRVALGALRSRIVAQFLARALRVVAVACAAGIALSLAFSRLLSGMLFGVSPGDPLTLGVVVALVAGVAALAAWLPAVRAARVEPMRVLREE